MFLKRFIFVNWGNIPGLEFEFGPVNLFSGGNGSGKTTAADAIQTIMTAAHEPGAGRNHAAWPRWQAGAHTRFVCAWL